MYRYFFSAITGMIIRSGRSGRSGGQYRDKVCHGLRRDNSFEFDWLMYGTRFWIDTIQTCCCNVANGYRLTSPREKSWRDSAQCVTMFLSLTALGLADLLGHQFFITLLQRFSPNNRLCMQYTVDKPSNTPRRYIQ